MSEIPLLQARGLSKSFGGVKALEAVDFELLRGEVHAVVGENGAGKSTLMKLLAGLEQPDAGTFEFQGRQVRFPNPHAALSRGIHLIHQELLPYRDMTVAENLFAGQEPTRGMLGWLDRTRMREDSRRLLARLGMDLDPDRRMGDLTVAQTQLVEISRGLARTAQVLILDEPTSALSQFESDRLLGILAELRGSGVALIYISHKLEEVSRLADRITVLRDGRRVLTRPTPELSPAEVIRHMVGRDLATNHRDARTECRGELVLEADRLTCPDRFENVSFRLRRGEVLGLAGLIGAGRTEVASALIGLVHGVEGEMRLEGRAFRPRHPAEALAAGVAMVTEDRQDSGLIGTMSVKGNLTLSALDQYCHAGWIDGRLEAKAAASWVRDLSIRSAGLNQEIGALSGGNQQKVLLARALMTRPTILILDEPTRGIDVGAKAEIYDWIRRLAEQGMAILLVSSELTELLLLCDRVLILCEGKVTGELAADEATEEGILALAMPRAAG